MNKKPFVIFGLVLVLLIVVVPFWAFKRDGDPSSDRTKVPTSLEQGQTLFQDNCGNCHRLYAAGSVGDFGPDLDRQLAPSGTPTGETAAKTIDGTRKQVLNVIEQGYDNEMVRGRMPAGIVSGTVAESVADFVAATAGRG